MNDKAKATGWKIKAKDSSDDLHRMIALLGLTDEDLQNAIQDVGDDPDELREYFNREQNKKEQNKTKNYDQEATDMDYEGGNQGIE
jgi:hypothetical protein